MIKYGACRRALRPQYEVLPIDILDAKGTAPRERMIHIRHDQDPMLVIELTEEARVVRVGLPTTAAS